MADSTNISVFGQEAFFSERANFYNDINVSGNVNFTGNLYQNGSLINISGNGSGGESVWVTNSVGIHTLSNVGIGTETPKTKLEVWGTVSFGSTAVETYPWGSTTETATISIGGSTTNARYPNGDNNNNILIGNGVNQYQGFGFYPPADNVIIGAGAGNTLGSAVSSVIIGARAGGGSIYGSYGSDVIIGYRAAFNKTISGSNVYIGARSGAASTSGALNTFIGDGSGEEITYASNNTIVGRFNGNQNGLDLRTSDSNVVLSDGLGNVRFYANSSGNVGIGITNPSQKLTVSNNILLGTSVSGSSATPSYIDLGTNYSNGTTRDKLKIYLYNDTTYDIIQKYGFGVGGNGDIQYHSNAKHAFYIANNEVTALTSTLLGTVSNAQFGLDIGYKKSVTITGSFAANTWYNTGIDRTTDTGIYLLSAYVDTYNTAQSYQMSYIGWFVMPNRNTNSVAASNITLHSAGHAPNAEVIQFRTLLTPGGDSKIYLQWLSNFALTLDGSAGRNIQVAIYRFATAFNN